MSHCLLLNFEDFSLNQDITQTIQSHTPICICCLEKSVRVISLGSCSHSDFLNNFSIPDIKPHDKVICFQCHSVLKKIKQFELQVHESFNILNTKVFNVPVTHLRRTRLKIEKAVDILINQTNYGNETHSIVPSNIEDKNINIDAGNNTSECVRLKNIQTALDIINSNNSLPLLGLLSGIKNLRNDVLGTAVNDSLNVNIATPPSAGEYVNTEKKNNNAPELSTYDVERTQTNKHHHNPIRKVKLTKNQLNRERYLLSWSKTYLKYPYKCKGCIQGFNYKENLEDHTARKHDAKLGSVCEICKQYHPAGTLPNHIYRHFIRYLCVVCYKKYPSRDDAVFHYTKEHVKGYKCGNCPYVAEDVTMIRSHRVKKHRFLCECGDVFVTSRRLRRHVLMKHKRDTSNARDEGILPSESSPNSCMEYRPSYSIKCYVDKKITLAYNEMSLESIQEKLGSKHTCSR